MNTKLRLLGDFALQSSLIILFSSLIFWQIAYFWLYALLLGLSSNLWQILYALYMVKQHNDWQKRSYLQQMKKVLGYMGLCFGGIFGMWLISFGLLHDFCAFAARIFFLFFTSVGVLAALYNFADSIKSLYLHYYRNRSFWDLK